MVMYADEFKTKEKQKLTEIKKKITGTYLFETLQELVATCSWELLRQEFIFQFFNSKVENKHS